MITINAYLEDVLSDFKDYLMKKPKLCCLKGLNFQGGAIPDYDNPYIQQLYLLRYGYAYSFEYKNMYSDFFDNLDIDRELSIVSFGCGNMVDYWSCIQALEQKHERKCIVEYYGLDLIDWDYKFEKRPKDSIEFIQQDASQWIYSNRDLDYDIFIFPKSISEFSPEGFKIICDCFEKKPIHKDKIGILISLRSDERSMDRDMQRTGQLINSLMKSGFETSFKYNQYTHFRDQTKGIRHYDNSFLYPDEAKPLIQSLNEMCYNFIKNKTNCSSDCAIALTRQPVLKPTTIRYQIIPFERE